MKAQDIIYQLEEGKGAAILGRVALVVGVIAFALIFHFRAYQNLSDPQAMEMAQLARNLATGKGYTTQVVRPVALELVEEREAERGAALRDNRFPDIVNPPIYPLLLAGLMKLAPLDFEVEDNQELIEGGFKYGPEVWISWLNQGLFFALLLLVFDLAKRWFDRHVAYMSVALILGSLMFWQFTISGATTMLMMVWVAVLLRVMLATFQEVDREEGVRSGRAMGLAAALGVVIGLAFLTRYAFLALLVPVLIVGGFGWGPRRWAMMGVSAAACLLVCAPWIARNLAVSGLPFGLTGLAMFEETAGMSDSFLHRDLQLELSTVALESIIRKGVLGFGAIWERELLTIAGSWIGVFFIAGLAHPFSNPQLNRARALVALSALVFLPIQAIGATQALEAAGGYNNQNHLAVFAPWIVVFGVAFLVSLIEGWEIPQPRLVTLVCAGVVALFSLPFLIHLGPPKPFAMPLRPFFPYHPARIQEVASYTTENELIMTDFPWAVAWYGDRQAIWATLDPNESFDAVHLDRKGVAALYLSEFTVDERFMSQILYADRDMAWGHFAVNAFLGNIPPDFPLRSTPPGFLPVEKSGTQILLTARRRWESQ